MVFLDTPMTKASDIKADTTTPEIDPRYAQRALLPDGFRDRLMPAAERAFALGARFVDGVLLHGYELVSPPSVEYETSLLAGPGAELDRQMFRMMDSETQRVMALRADITGQLARLASTRLADMPRPLRMAYVGNVVRLKGSMLRPSREYTQMGAELVGVADLAADLEIMLLALDSLSALSVVDITIDLTAPVLFNQLAAASGLPASDIVAIRACIEAKDSGSLKALGSKAAIFIQLIEAAGPADIGLQRLEALDLPADAAQTVADMAQLYRGLAIARDDLNITIDPCEFRGFDYKSGVGFALFTADVRGELGRGGRYVIDTATGEGEAAVGFSLYLDQLLMTKPGAAQGKRLYVPMLESRETLAFWRAQGYRTVQGLSAAPQTEDAACGAAMQLGCDYVLIDGSAKAILNKA